MPMYEQLSPSSFSFFSKGSCKWCISCPAAESAAQTRGSRSHERPPSRRVMSTSTSPLLSLPRRYEPQGTASAAVETSPAGTPSSSSTVRSASRTAAAISVTSALGMRSLRSSAKRAPTFCLSLSRPRSSASARLVTPRAIHSAAVAAPTPCTEQSSSRTAPRIELCIRSSRARRPVARASSIFSATFGPMPLRERIWSEQVRTKSSPRISFAALEYTIEFQSLLVPTCLYRSASRSS
mmetsp:Transcript_20237/g.66851  ORF Transcript_20237/g.66851 Transcript_20237/m.66851 type:complete len:238 (-) Transcript_20237:273-986(-)